jgi:hypothetical protein
MTEERITELADKLTEIADCCRLAAEQVTTGTLDWAVSTIDECVEFGGDTLEKVQRELQASQD